MKFLIKESQHKSIKTRISKSIAEKGMWTTMEDFNLSLKTLDVIYRNSKLPELTCQDLSDFMAYLVFKQIVNTKNIKKDGYHLNFDLDGMSEALFFKITDIKRLDSLEGFATPYYNGECRLPIELDYYQYVDDVDEAQDHSIAGQYFESVNLKNLEFSSFSDIKKWFENDYLKILINYCEPIFSELRD